MISRLATWIHGLALIVAMGIPQTAVPWPEYALNMPDGIAHKYLTVAAGDASQHPLQDERVALPEFAKLWCQVHPWLQLAQLVGAAHGHVDGTL